MTSSQDTPWARAAQASPVEPESRPAAARTMITPMSVGLRQDNGKTGQAERRTSLHSSWKSPATR